MIGILIGLNVNSGSIQYLFMKSIKTQGISSMVSQETLAPPEEKAAEEPGDAEL